MSIIFAYVPSAYKAGTAYTAIPNDGTADFSCSRPVAADRIDPNGNVESMGVNVPRIDYAGGGCPVLLTGADDKITNAQVSFDASLGVFEFTTAFILKATTNKISISDGGSTNRVQFSPTNGGTDSLNIYYSSALGNGSTPIYSMDMSLSNTYQWLWQGNAIELKVNGITVFKRTDFDGFQSDSFTRVHLGKYNGVGEDLTGRTKSILIHDSHDTKDKYLFKTFDEMASFANYKIIQ